MLSHTSAARRALLSLGGLGLLAACAEPTPQVQSQPARNLTDLLASDSSFERFVAAASRTGLSQTLSGAGPYTVFAFTNSGWDSLPAFQRESLLGPDVQRLATVMNSLVVDGRVPISSLSGQRRELTTRQGTRLVVDATNPQRVAVESAGLAAGVGAAGLRTAYLVRQDIEASNGILHVLSQIVLP